MNLVPLIWELMELLARNKIEGRNHSTPLLGQVTPCRELGLVARCVVEHTAHDVGRTLVDPIPSLGP